jgi:DNA-binding NtrC family response regulator
MTTLLVVGEEANTRLLFKDEFQNDGYLVTVVETTQEAMNIIQHCKPDMIVLHLKIPGIKEFALLKNIKEQESNISVVLWSAYASFRDDFRARMCDAFIVQSADLTELKTAIKRMLGYKRPAYVRKVRSFMEADRRQAPALTNFSWKVS